MRILVLAVVAALLFTCRLHADELTYGWEASGQTNVFWPDIESGLALPNLVDRLATGDLGGLLPDAQVRSEGQASASASYTTEGDGYKLGVGMDVSAHGKVEVLFPGSEFYVSPHVSSYVQNYWHGRFSILGENELPFNSILTNWKVDGIFSGSVGVEGYVSGSVQLHDIFGGADGYASFEYRKYWDNTEEQPKIVTEGSPAVSGLLSLQYDIGSGRDVSYGGYMTVDGVASNGTLRIGFDHTAELTSITFPDGSTPESHGFTVVMDSGLPSPNLISVPEPSSLLLATIGSVAICIAATRRRPAR